MKQCPKCEKHLVESLFYKHKRTCKLCISDYARNLYQNNESYRNKAKERSKQFNLTLKYERI